MDLIWGNYGIIHIFTSIKPQAVWKTATNYIKFKNGKAG
jgi:hypothetical protein